MSAQRQGRHLARRALCQAMYQHAMNTQPLHELCQQFVEEPTYALMDRDYFERVLTACIEEQDALDGLIDQFATRARASMTPVDLAVMRVATAELLHCLDIPYRVVISEALTLSTMFGATDATKFVNGVLDRVAKACRPEELPGVQHAAGDVA